MKGKVRVALLATVAAVILVCWLPKAGTQNAGNLEDIWGPSAHWPFCVSVSGHSIGARNFCEDCESIERNVDGQDFSATPSVPKRRGLGVLWTGVPGNPWSQGHPRTALMSRGVANISVTAIEIDGVPLQGWFHLSITIPFRKAPERQFYADGEQVIHDASAEPYTFAIDRNGFGSFYGLIVQVEDDLTGRAIGEFTTDLMDSCEISELRKGGTPTVGQILPCHSTGQNQVMNSNTVVFYVDNDSMSPTTRPGDFLRTTDDNSLINIHLNWRMPPGYGCSYTKRFYVRLLAITKQRGPVSPSDPTVRDVPIQECGGTCYFGPRIHTAKRVRIYTPDLNGQFDAPDPLPPFLDRTQVNCHVPIRNNETDPSVTQDVTQPFVEFKLNRKGPFNSPGSLANPFSVATTTTDCSAHCPVTHNPLPHASIGCQSWYHQGGRPHQECAEPSPPGRCAFGAGVFLSTTPNDQVRDYFGNASDLHPPLPLFVGRCNEQNTRLERSKLTIAPGKENMLPVGDANAGLPILCRNASAIDADYARDEPFLKTLLNVTEYIDKIRYDICDCFPPLPGLDDGSLNFPADLPVGAAPTPDYPVDPPVVTADPGLGPDSLANELLSALSSAAAVHNLGSGISSRPKCLAKAMTERVKTGRMLHEIAAAIVFLFVLPISIFVARYLKEGFYGRSAMTYDVWYTFHGLSLMLVTNVLIVSIILGWFSRWTLRRADPVDPPPGLLLHKYLGILALVLYAFLFVTGGLRSLRCLTLCINLHGMIGTTFYYLSLICVIIYLGGNKNRLALPGLAIFAAWIVIDIVFHVVMTVHYRCMDRKVKLYNRVYLPVMELVIDDQNAPGTGFRYAMCGVYAALAFILMASFIGLSISSGGFVTPKIDPKVSFSQNDPVRNIMDAMSTAQRQHRH